MSHTSISARQITWLGLVINIFLVILKLFLGMVGFSQALIADAIHSLSDLATDVAVLIGLRTAGRPVDENHNYGHGKFETLASVFISLVLFLAAFYIMFNGVALLYDAVQGNLPERPKKIALIGAFVSIVLKEYLYRITVQLGRATRSNSLIANAWHHRSDAMSSVAAFFGIGAASMLGNQWIVLDPIAAIFVGILLMVVAYKLMMDNLNELMEASLDKIEQEEILQMAVGISGIYRPHNLRTRKIGRHIAIDMHVKVRPDLSIVDAHTLATKVEQKLFERFGRNSFISIHVEPLSEEPDSV
jgi:cation diffusion facilitator family transporter